MRSLVYIVLATGLAASLAGCGRNPFAAESLDLEHGAFQDVPQTVLVRGVVLQVSAQVWRDFMPIQDPAGSPLIAGVRLSTPGTVPLPQPVVLEGVTVIRSDEAWAAAVSEGWRTDHEIGGAASGGPRWEIGSPVEVILRFRVDGEPLRLRSAPTVVFRTE